MKGWCVGCNPPSVPRGIRLIGLPALQVETSSASVCPFHLQDSRFTASHPASSTTQSMHHRHLPDGRFRFCSGAKALALRPCERCSSTCGRSFLRPLMGGSKATHQLASPKNIRCRDSNKNFGSIFLATLNYIEGGRLNHV